MIINENFLLEFGAECFDFFPEKVLCNKDEIPLYFFSIKNSIVELIGYHKDGTDLNILHTDSV